MAEQAPKRTPHETVTLQLKWPHHAHFMGFYAAKEMGFYSDAGLYVHFREGATDENPVSSLLDGSAEYAVSTPQAMLAHSQGAPILLLGAIMQHSPLTVIMHPQGPAPSLFDLLNHDIMLTPQTELPLTAMLQKEGMPLNNLRIVAPSKDPLQSFIDNETDAFSGYLTRDAILLSERQIPHQILHPSTYGIDFYGDLLISTRKEADNHTQRLEKFLAATLKGWRYALNHPEEMVTLIREKYTPNKDIDVLRREVFSLKRYMRDDLVNIGHLNIGRLEYIRDLFINTGLLDPEYDMEGLLFDPHDYHIPFDVDLLVQVGVILAVVLLLGLTSLILLYLFSKHLQKAVNVRTIALQESEYKYRRLFENANDPVIICNDTEIFDANPKACALFGYTKDDLLSESPKTPESDRDSLIEFKAALFASIESARNASRAQRQMTCKNGTIIDVEISRSIVSKQNNEMQCIIRDISAQKALEKALINREQMYRQMIDQSPLGTFLYQDDKITYANKKFIAMAEANTLDQVKARPVHDYVLPAYRKYITATLDSDPIHSKTHEMKIKTFADNIRTIESRAISVTLEGVQQHLVVIYDITEKKEAEKALRNSERLLRRAQEMARIGHYVYHEGKQELIWSDSLYGIYGFPPDSQPPSWEEQTKKLHHSQTGQKIDAIFTQERKERQPYIYEYQITRPDGEECILHATAEWEKDENGALTILRGVVQDITEQRASESKQRESERQLAAFFDQTFQFMWVMDLDGIILKTNKAAESAAPEGLGMIGKPLWETPWWPDGTVERSRLDDALQEAAKGRTVRMEIRYNQNQDTPSVMDFSLKPLKNDKGEAVSLIAEGRDISQLRKTIAALEDSERHYKALFDSAGDGILLLEQDVITECNQKALELFKTTRQALLSNNPFDHSPLFQPDGTPSRKKGLGYLIAAYKGEAPTFEWEFQRDGQQETFSAEMTLTKLDFSGAPQILALIRDISDRKTTAYLERMLLQTQKMEAIGRLAGGIAHDFNNFLGAIMGFASFLVEDLKENSPQHGYAQKILTTSKRAKEMTAQILNFSRRKNIEKRSMDITQLVQETKGIVQAMMPSNITLNEEIDATPLTMHGSSHQISQMLINLYVNAHDAIGNNHGTITFRLRNVLADNDLVSNFYGTKNPSSLSSPNTIQSRPDGTLMLPFGQVENKQTYALIEVEDTGCGIPKDTLVHIFEPFFTTKDTGAGTGLGLSALHGLLESHKGACIVSTHPGSGTCFQLYLPCELKKNKPPKKTKKAKREQAAKDVAPKKKISILVVDDEKPITDMLETALTRQGFKVTAYNDPQEALAFLKKTRKKFDVIISDQIMPNMKGVAFLREAKEIKENIATILCSGYTGDTTETDVMKEGIDAFLMKPILPDTLQDLIEEIYESKQLIEK